MPTFRCEDLDALARACLDRVGVPAADAALGRLEAAGLKPGDALRYPDNPLIDRFIEALTGGPFEPYEERPTLNPQNSLN